MSVDVGNLQAQVESVLGALVKAATVELTKLFESRYRASAAVDAGRTPGEGRDTPDTLGGPSAAEDTTKRSIGVQVDSDMCPVPQLPGPLFLSSFECEVKYKEDLAVVEGCLIPSEILPAGSQRNGYVDPLWSTLKEGEVVADSVETDKLESNVLETKTEADCDAQTQIVLNVCADSSTSDPTSSQKPLVVLADTGVNKVEEDVKFVCPLIIKPESPASKADSVSTAQGTAYSPSPSDGAATPVPVRLWERIQSPKKKKNNLQMKLKRTSPDKKLLGRCEVQLVNVLDVPPLETKLQRDGAKNGWRLPKDLRHHKGLHTGHRLCCFTAGRDAVWRLQTVVAHSRDGYACKVCEKSFKHRKILRRHERFHSGEKPYPCASCSKTFALRKSLRRHLRFHTGERPHTCAQCGKSFRLRENLKSHLRFHSGEKPFNCATCGKTFRIFRNLEKHNLSQCGYFVPSFRTIAGL